MRPFVLILIFLSTVAGCEQYRPSEANCFSFVARGPADKNCDFEPLDGANLSSGRLE